MLKRSLSALLACLAAAAPAAAATFTYTGAPFASPGTSGFKRIALQFTTPGTLQPNTTYALTTLGAYNDGLNRLPALVKFLAAGKAFGGTLDSYLYGTVTTGATGQPASWLFKVSIFFKDALGNEGYDMVVSGPGNAAAQPGVFDTIYTTLPETLPSTVSLSSKRYGTLTAR